MMDRAPAVAATASGRTGQSQPAREDTPTRLGCLYQDVKNQTLSAGLDLVPHVAQENTDYPATVNAQFGGNWTGFGIADFMTGNVDSFTQGGGEISSVKGG